MKKKIIIGSVTVLLLFLLFFPFGRSTVKDGGTKVYTALTYRVVKWNRIYDVGLYTDNTEIYKNTSFYFFPNNFKDIDTLWLKEEEKFFEKLGEAGVGQNRSVKVSPFDTFSDAEGIFIQFKSADLLADEPYIKVSWRNLRDTEYCFGEEFDILYSPSKGDDELGNSQSCAVNSREWTALGYVIPPNGEHVMRYSLSDFDLSRNSGLYCFMAPVAHFENGETQYVRMFFTLSEDAAQPAVTAEHEISELYQKIITPDDSSVYLSSNPFDYMMSSIDEYSRLVYSGDAVLEYSLGHLRNSGQGGLQEYIMASVCSQITGIGSKYDTQNSEWSTATEWLEIYNAQIS